MNEPALIVLFLAAGATSYLAMGWLWFTASPKSWRANLGFAVAFLAAPMTLWIVGLAAACMAQEQSVWLSDELRKKEGARDETHFGAGH